MNILLINHYAGSPQLGMEYRPFYFSKEWKKNGHQVYVVAASFAHLRSQQISVTAKTSLMEINHIPYIILRTPQYFGNSKKRILNMLRFIWRLYRYKNWLPQNFKPDVVIASSTYPLEIFPLRRIAKETNAKLIFEVHDLWPLAPIELGGFSKYHPYIMMMQFAENYAYRKSDMVISMLPKAFEHMHEHGLDKNRYVHIPNGICVEDWQVRGELPELHKKLIQKLKKKKIFLVCYAGSIGIANALDCFVRAGKLIAHKKIHFIIVGDGPQKSNLLEIMSAENITNVSILPPIPKTNIPEFLNSMDVLYLSFQRQSLFRFGISPNKIMDYMMAGKPIIQAIEAGNDMTSEAECGITVEPENVEAVAGAVIKLYEMPERERNRLGKNGRKFVKKNHDYSILAKKYIDILSVL
jgi:glycosyltransferase involved in cell wall biosynthesis